MRKIIKILKSVVDWFFESSVERRRELVVI